jgi:glutamate-1-semialdehyde 2,1-aminomutase
VPLSYAAETLVAPYNDLPAVEASFQAHSGEIAAIIVEPVAANMGVVPPAEGFLDGLRRLCDANGALLIFDEVITGFRVGMGGYQAVCGVTPDLTCLGKVVGGGMPVGAYGGRREIMHLVAPLGPVYQAGTLSGNPLAMAAGLATLRVIAPPGFFESLDALTAKLVEGIESAAAEHDVVVRVNRVGSMFTVFFTPNEVTDYASARQADTKQHARFFHALLEAGVYFPPSQFEAIFVSDAHTDADLETTIAAAEAAFQALT